MNSNPADTDFAEHAALEAETRKQCAWCDLTVAPNSDLCDTCQIEEMDRLAEADYDPYSDPEWEPPCDCWCEMCGCHGYCYQAEDPDDGEDD